MWGLIETQFTQPLLVDTVSDDVSTIPDHEYAEVNLETPVENYTPTLQLSICLESSCKKHQHIHTGAIR